MINYTIIPAFFPKAGAVLHSIPPDYSKHI